MSNADLVTQLIAKAVADEQEATLLRASAALIPSDRPSPTPSPVPLPAPTVPVTDPTRPVDGPAPAPVVIAPTPPPVIAPAPAPNPAPILIPITLSPAVPTLANLTPDSYGAWVCMNPAFKPQHISETTLAALTTVETAGTPGEMVYDEGGTGYRPEIGYRALGAQLWATTMDPRARVHMFAEADLAKVSFPIHGTIQGVDGVPKPWLWSQPHYTALYNGNPYILVSDPLLSDGIKVDTSHFPQFLFDAACLAGIEGNAAKFAEYVEQMKWVVWFDFMSVAGNAPQYCQGSRYIINSLMGQQRGDAWNLRNVDDLLFVLEHLSPADEWIPWLASVIDETVRFNDGVFRTGDYETDGPEWAPYAQYPTGGFKNPWGITRGRDVYSDTYPCIALWQQGFQSAVLTRSFNRNHPSVSDATKAIHKQLVNWLGNLWLMIMGPANDPASFDYRRQVYEFPTGTFTDPTSPTTSGVTFFSTAAAFRAYYDPLGPLGPDDRTLRNHADNNAAQLPGSFMDNLLPAAAAAVDAGVPGVLECLTRILTSVQGTATGGDLAFSWLHKGFKWSVDDATAPVATPIPIPILTPVINPPTPIAPLPPAIAGHVPVIPAYGQFASYPKVVGAVPEDVRPPMFAPGKSNDIGDDYNASAPLIPGTTKIARLSSGHNTPNFNPMGLFDYASGTYSFVNQPTSAHAEAPPNLPSILFPDGSIYTGHMYSGLIATPASWSRQGILQCFVGGSSYPNDIYIRDPNSVMGGVTQFNTNGPVTFYNNVSAGAYSKAAKSETKGLVFFLDEFNYGANGTVPTMNSDGVVTNITSYKIPFGIYEGGIMLVDDQHELLLGVAAQGQGASTMTVGVVDLNTKVTTNSQVAGGSINIVGRGAFPEFASLVWSNERDCAFGVYCADAANPTTSMKFGYLLPPATGDRRTGTWTWTEYALTHSPFDTEGDPGLVPPTSPASNYVACTWIPKDDVLLLFSNPAHRVQIIRPPKEAVGPAATIFKQLRNN